MINIKASWASAFKYENTLIYFAEFESKAYYFIEH